jgi:hypothetical protein
VLRQEVVPARDAGEPFAFRGEFHAAVRDDDGAGFELLGEAHVDQPEFGHVLGDEDAGDRIGPHPATALLELLEDVERQRAVSFVGPVMASRRGPTPPRAAPSRTR